MVIVHYDIVCIATGTCSKNMALDSLTFLAILYKLKLGQSVTTIPTVGFNVETVTYKNVKFNVWVSESIRNPCISSMYMAKGPRL